MNRKFYTSLIAIGVASLMFSGPARASEDACKGQSINILMETVPDTDAVQALKQDFENKHGASVNIEAVNYSLMHEKLVPSLTASEAQYNVLIVDSYWVGEFKTAGWLAPLDELIARDAIDTDVYIPSLMELNGRVQGVTYMLPFWHYAMGVLYRKDIIADPAFQAAYKEEFGREWRFPQSIEEFAEVVKWAGKFKNMYGIAMAAQRVDPVVMEATNYLFAAGGDFYDRSTWQPMVNSPQAAKSIEVYNDLLKNVAQPGALGANADDVANIMKQGKAIFAATYLLLYPTLQNPVDSAVVDKIDFAPMPGAGGLLGAWGWAIPANATNKECSWEFLKWVESRDIAYKRAMAGGQPAQGWIYEDGAFIAKWPVMAKFSDALKSGKGLPIMSRSTQLVETYAEVLGAVLVDGKTPTEALLEATPKFEQLTKGDPLLNQ